MVQFKHLRGKFRPNAKQLDRNTEEDVAQVSGRAIATASPRKAIEELSTLKGVGPATASCVLAVLRPRDVPFMADESVESIPGHAPIEYNIKAYEVCLFF